MYYCHHCGDPWNGGGHDVAVHETCWRCHSPIHCCLNCELHEKTGSSERCRSMTAELPADSSAKNYCDEFVFRSSHQPPQLRPTASETKRLWEGLWQR